MTTRKGPARNTRGKRPQAPAKKGRGKAAAVVAEAESPNAEAEEAAPEAETVEAARRCYRRMSEAEANLESRAKPRATIEPGEDPTESGDEAIEARASRDEDREPPASGTVRERTVRERTVRDGARRRGRSDRRRASRHREEEATQGEERGRPQSGYPRRRRGGRPCFRPRRRARIRVESAVAEEAVEDTSTFLKGSSKRSFSSRITRSK